MEQTSFIERTFSFKTILRSHRNQFWQNLGNTFAKNPELPTQVIKPEQKHLKNFLWAPNMLLKNAAKSFCPCRNVFRPKSEKQKRVFLKTLFSSKFSSGHNERKFGHTANFLA